MRLIKCIIKKIIRFLQHLSQEYAHHVSMMPRRVKRNVKRSKHAVKPVR
jgi:hypothetical protein